MLIRPETEKDYDEVYHLVKEAFAGAEHSDGNEQDLVVALRKGNSFIPELSLVAEINNKIVGHILFTKVKIGNSTELALAPLAVLPEYQKQGVGTSLIQRGHKTAKQLGYHFSIVLGSDKYYPKSGYIPAHHYHITPPFDAPAENFMAYRLSDETFPVEGIVIYDPAFGIE